MTRAALWLALALLCFAGAAMAACTDHDALAARLAEGWGESRQSIALGGNGAVVETFANPETGSWTIAVTTPGGPTCIVAAGTAFEAVEPVPEGELG